MNLPTVRGFGTKHSLFLGRRRVLFICPSKPLSLPVHHPHGSLASSRSMNQEYSSRHRLLEQ